MADESTTQSLNTGLSAADLDAVRHAASDASAETVLESGPEPSLAEVNAAVDAVLQTMPPPVADAPEKGDSADLLDEHLTSTGDSTRSTVSTTHTKKPAPTAPRAKPMDLPDFGAGSNKSRGHGSMDLLKDVEMHVTIELGRARMNVEDVLKLGEGSIVELDKLAGDPVDVLVNDRLVARGEVLILNDAFSVRINEIFAGRGAIPTSEVA